MREHKPPPFVDLLTIGTLPLLRRAWRSMDISKVNSEGSLCGEWLVALAAEVIFLPKYTGPVVNSEILHRTESFATLITCPSTSLSMSLHMQFQGSWSLAEYQTHWAVGILSRWSWPDWHRMAAARRRTCGCSGGTSHS